MKRIFSMLLLVAVLAVGSHALAYEQGDEVEVCNADGQYVLLAPEASCEGNVEAGVVKEVHEGQIVVELGSGEAVTLSVE